MSQDNSIEELILKAYNCIQNTDLVGAMEIGKEILAKDSDNLKGLEIMGYILLEMNCLEEAKFCFSKSIESDNCESHVPYLYLGQLTEGEESVKFFNIAITIMIKNLDQKEKKLLFPPSKLDVSNAYVSLCELYMTDLCDKENAEEQCMDYIKKAIEIDSSNPASWQSKASLHLIKNETELAKESIQKSIDLWLSEAIKIMSNAEKDESDNDIITTCELSSELRIKCAEILFELKMFTEARSVVETVLIEDDEYFQAHYLIVMILDSMFPEPSNEILGLIEDHAEMAIGLANPEIESDAISKMMSILEKIGVDHHDDNDCGSDCESQSDDEDMDDQ